jgi:hypothetical protein
MRERARNLSNIEVTKEVENGRFILRFSLAGLVSQPRPSIEWTVVVVVVEMVTTMMGIQSLNGIIPYH